MIFKKIFFILFILIIPISLFSETGRLIKGVILEDEKGLAIPGARISVVGTNTGTYTSSNGQFRLNVPAVKISLKSRQSVTNPLKNPFHLLMIRLSLN